MNNLTPEQLAFRAGYEQGRFDAQVETAQQQEPVAWRTKNATPPGGYVLFQQYPQAVAELGGEIQPLYTSPQPSKPWVGLTEEEIQPLLSQNRFAVFALARAIEAKLREKNA